MSEIVFVLPARDADALHRSLTMLSFQKDLTFRVVVLNLTGEGVGTTLSEFESRLKISVAEEEASTRPFWQWALDAAGDAQWVCFLKDGIDLTPTSVKRLRRCIAGHDGYDVFHWNLADPFPRLRLKTSAGQLFEAVFSDGVPAPIGSFVIRTEALRAAFEADPEAAGMELGVILSAARNTGIRSVRRERVAYRVPAPVTDPVLEEKAIRSRLAFFRWSERFFGDDYPLGTGDRLNLFAGELALLYPSYSPDELKEDLNTFAVVNGPIRRMKASSALKAALKTRQETLQRSAE